MMSIFSDKGLNNQQLIWLIFIGSLIPTLYFSATGNPLAAAVPAFVGLLVVTNLRTDQVFDIIFWTSFSILFLGNRLIQKFVFSIDALGIKNQLYWGVDMLIILILFRMLLMNRYKNRVLIFIAVLGIIFGITTFINNVSPARAFLAFRSNYLFLLLIFLVFIYDFKLNYFRKYFRLFLILALVNSALSAISLMYYGVTVSGDGNGGIFGSNGTGIGLLFVVLQASIFLQIYYLRRKNVDIIYMIITMAFIVTGKGFFGFPLLFGSLLILFLIRMKNQDRIRRILVLSVGAAGLFAMAFFLIPKEQSERVVQRFTNIEAFLAYDRAGGQMGRIGSLLYGYNRISKSLSTTIFGYGPGTISYRGATTGIGNEFQSIGGRQWVMPSMAYLYEFGFLGVLLIIWCFFYFFRQWRQVRVWPTGLERVYLQNIPIVLFVYFVCIFYTNAFKIYFLVFYFALYLSFMRRWLMQQPLVEQYQKKNN